MSVLGNNDGWMMQLLTGVAAQQLSRHTYIFHCFIPQYSRCSSIHAVRMVSSPSSFEISNALTRSLSHTYSKSPQRVRCDPALSSDRHLLTSQSSRTLYGRSPGPRRIRSSPLVPTGTSAYTILLSSTPLPSTISLRTP